MKSKHIFFGKTEFQVFLSALIAKQYCKDDSHHLFTFTPRVEKSWHLTDWNSRTLLPWPEEAGSLKQYWRLHSHIHNVLRIVGDRCEGADEIIVHTYEIFSERINYLIPYLRRRFPRSKLRFRLIPDGTLNLTRRPMSGLRKIPQWINRIKWFWDPNIRTYAYKGDRLGADAEIVDRIYLPRGFPNQYDSKKVYPIELPAPEVTASSSPGRTALVVGTALTQTLVCTPSDMRLIASRVEQCLREHKISKVWYKMHHLESEDQRELWSPDYEIMRTHECVERILTKQKFDLLIGNCSTSLITARLMYPDLPIVSCGLDLIEQRARKGRSVHQYRRVCNSLGVSLVSVLNESNETLHEAAICD